MDESTQIPAEGVDSDDTTDADEIDGEARIDYDKAKAKGKLFSTNAGNRITETIEGGESSWSEWPRQRGAK